MEDKQREEDVYVCENCSEKTECSAFLASCEVCDKKGCVQCFKIPFIALGSIENRDDEKWKITGIRAGENGRATINKVQDYAGGDTDMDFCPDCFDAFKKAWKHDDKDTMPICEDMKSVKELKGRIKVAVLQEKKESG